MLHRPATWLLALVTLACASPPQGGADAIPPAAAGPPALPGAPPDIVVIMADDLDEETLRDAAARGWLPHLSALEAGGTRFASSFVTLSLCCPSRSSFLTGRYPHNTGVLSNVMPEGSVEVFDDSSTVATWLQAGGYRTGHVGKYLNRYGRHGTGGAGALGSTYVPPGWSDWQATVDPTTYRMYDYTINDNGRLISHGGAAADYQTDVLAARAVDFIEETPAGTPMFLLVTPLAVHLEAAEEDPEASALVRPAPRHAWVLDEPIDIPRGPAFDEADVSDKPNVIRNAPPLTAEDQDYLRRQYRGRAASLLAVDDLLGSVQSALAARGRLDRSIVVFTSDNGWLYGEHRVSQKRYPYEESIRVPLIIRDFRQSTPPVASGMALNIDLAPTIARWAGVAAPAVDGRSLAPLLAGPAPADWRRRFLVRGPVHSRVNFVGVRTGPGDPLAPDRIYVHYQERCGQRCDELYRLDVDPFQLDSTPGPERADRQVLEGWLERLDGCAGGQCRRYESCAELASGC